MYGILTHRFEHVKQDFDSYYTSSHYRGFIGFSHSSMKSILIIIRFSESSNTTYPFVIAVTAGCSGIFWFNWYILIF